MWRSVAYKDVWRNLCSATAENHQLHGDILAGEVLLYLCATTSTASYLDPWLRSESNREAGPSGTKLAVKAVALLGPV